jgi:hypothetical protein
VVSFLALDDSFHSRSGILAVREHFATSLFFLLHLTKQNKERHENKLETRLWPIGFIISNGNRVYKRQYHYKYLHHEQQVRVCFRSVRTCFECCHKIGLTKRMTTGELGFLGITCLQLVTNGVQQLHVALLRILLQSSDESPRHSAGCLRCDGRVRTR